MNVRVLLVVTLFFGCAATAEESRMETTKTDAQLAALQEQVRVLQQQVATLQAVLQVTPAGVTLQAPSVLIKTTGGAMIEAANEVTIKAGAAARMQAGAQLDVQGATVRLNGGGRPIATVGSQVINGAVQTGSTTVFGG